MTQASLTIVGAGAGRSIPICMPSFTTPVPGTVWSASREIALFCSVGWTLTLQFGHLVPVSCPLLLLQQLTWS